MKRITEKLLSGSSVGPASHPVMVSLLELAAQGPGFPGGVSATIKTRQARAWKAIAREFRRCDGLRVSDKELRAVLPFDGLEFSDADGWRIISSIPLEYRTLVARAFAKVADAKEAAKMRVYPITCIEELRRARRRNFLPGLESAISAGGRLEGRLLPGRRLIISHPLYGVPVYSLCESDDYGRLTAILHNSRKLAVNKWIKLNPPKS